MFSERPPDTQPSTRARWLAARLRRLAIFSAVRRPTPQQPSDCSWMILHPCAGFCGVPDAGFSPYFCYKSRRTKTYSLTLTS